jgi:predicted phosphodiesterase
MTRIAAIYDIHGNLPALEAVLDEIGRAGVDQIVVGGDVVPGPMPRECIDRLSRLDIPAHFISGNGERDVLAWRRGIESSKIPAAFREIMRWNAEQLRPEDAELLADWPATLRLNLSAFGTVLFCHATPRNDSDIFTRNTPDDRLRPVFESAGAPFVVCGHTHMQFDRTIGHTRIVNAGSVGMPFGEPGAYWLLLETDVQLKRTRYDLTEAADRIRATEYPQAEDFAARHILQPPSEEQMLAAYSRAELQ